MIFLRSQDRKKNPIWQVRIKIPGEPKAHRKSTKESNKSAAIAKAFQTWTELKARVAQGLAMHFPSWDQLFEECIADRERNNRKASKSHEMWRRKNRLYFERFFGDPRRFKDTSELTQDGASRYWDWRLRFWEEHAAEEGVEAQNFAAEPKYQTLLQEQQYLNALFAFGVRKNYIDRDIRLSIPSTVDHDDARGATFSPEAYRRLIDTLEGWHRLKWAPNPSKGKRAKLKKDQKRRIERMRVWVYLIANTGIRVQEAKHLRFSDVRLEYSERIEQQFTQITIRREVSKKKEARLTIAADFERTHERVEKFRSTWALHNKPSDLIFASDKTPSKPVDMSFLFRKLIEQAGVAYDEAGKKRRSTSLRHYYIEQQVRQLVPPHIIAKNAGTSIAMIERHYDHLIPQTFIDLLVRQKELAYRQKQAADSEEGQTA